MGNLWSSGRAVGNAGDGWSTLVYAPLDLLRSVRTSSVMSGSSGSGPVAMTADGEDEGTVQARANREKICNKFLLHISTDAPELSKRWGLQFASVPEEEICSQEFWGHLATYLVEVYISEKTAEKLGHKSACAVWGTSLYALKSRFQHTNRDAIKVRLRLCCARCVRVLHAPSCTVRTRRARSQASLIHCM